MKRTLLLATALFALVASRYSYADMQKDFTDIAVKYKNEIIPPKNDVQIRILLKKRTKEFSALNFDGKVQNWSGTISRISTFGDNIYFDIELAPKIKLSFYTEVDDPIVETIAEMKQGQNVIFSGHLVPEPDDRGFEETSITTKGSLEEPEFRFTLTDIKLAQ